VKKRIISSEKRWEKGFDFSQGVEAEGVNRVVWLAGQTSYDGEKVVGSDIGAQTRLAYGYILEYLAKAGMTMSSIVYERINLTDMAMLEDALKARHGFYEDYGFPPATFTAVKALALPELLIEIEVVAVK